MSRNRWSIAAAKAELSHVVRSAQRAPQVIENRGEPVAVVIAFDAYEELSDRERRSARRRAFLDFSLALGEHDGFDLEIPPRATRPSPFGRSRS